MTTTPTVWQTLDQATEDPGFQFDGQIVGLADGGYFVAWQDTNPFLDRIVGQRFDILGQKVGHEITLGKLAGRQHLTSGDCDSFAWRSHRRLPEGGD